MSIQETKQKRSFFCWKRYGWHHFPSTLQNVVRVSRRRKKAGAAWHRRWCRLDKDFREGWVTPEQAKEAAAVMASAARHARKVA